MAVTTKDQAMAARDGSAGQNIPPTTPTIKRTRPSSSSGSENEEREAKRVKTSTNGKGKAVDRVPNSEQATGSSHPNAILPAFTPSQSASKQPTAGDQDKAIMSDNPASEDPPLLTPIDTSHPLIAAEIIYRAGRERDFERPERRYLSRMQRRNVRRLCHSQQECDANFWIDETRRVDDLRWRVRSSRGWNERGDLIYEGNEEEEEEEEAEDSDESTVLEGSDKDSDQDEQNDGKEEDAEDVEPSGTR